eukprot:CAMPEP_0117820198 /NCGR_PEP_ID=MMETSP0949-20121206/2328_1 /TAXON_ID=44440 /ORGANISM="Chattonella subsalsa, Strain CCMP2191" /LENGTH=38 /DNA_ID= /DNA_START= /DNA_END= /DNA_ORIENTATION=
MGMEGVATTIGTTVIRGDGDGDVSVGVLTDDPQAFVSD